MSISNALVWGNAHNIMPIGIKRLFNIIASQLNLYLPELDNKETIVCLWIVWAHNDLKFGCYDCIVLEIAKNYDIFVDESEIKGTIEALIDKRIVHRSVTKSPSHKIEIGLDSGIQNKIVDECSKELAFIAEQARKIGKLTCPRCGSMDINISNDDPTEFMFCHDCNIMRMPEPVVDDKNENKNKKKRKIDEEFLNDLTLACIQELMSSRTEELEKDVYMSNDYATFRFSSPTKSLGAGWKKIGTIKPPEKIVEGIESIKIAPRYLYEVDDGNNSVMIGGRSYDWDTLKIIYHPFLYKKSFVKGSIVERKGLEEYTCKRAVAEGWYKNIKEKAESIANHEAEQTSLGQ
jgi:hypothetical protein